LRAGERNGRVKAWLDRADVGGSDLQPEVHLGMASRAETVTERQSLLALLVKKSRETISVA
jgi:hypothetical protein